MSLNLDAFDDGAREHVTVCGTAYTCVGSDDTGYRWSSGANKPGVRGCRIDSLAAAASAMGNCVVPPTAPEACHRQEPCLHASGTDGTDGTLHCYSQNTTSLPNELSATLACAADVPTTTTHVKSHIEQHGGLESYVLTPRATPPLPTASHDAPAPPLHDAPAASDGAWQVCNVHGRPRLACAVDADCPLSTPAFDVWFSEAHKNAKGTRSAHAFLEALDHPDVATSMPPSKRKASNVQDVKRELRLMYENDAAFHSSVDGMLGEEYADAVAKKRYTCEDGGTQGRRCGRKAPTPAVRTGIADGTDAVEFTLRAGKVEYVDATGVHEANAVPCDHAGAKCNGNVREYGLGDATRVTVDPTTDAAFVLSFRDQDYYVDNVLYASGDAACAAQLCARNAGQCPAPLCRLDDAKECVPA